MFKKSRITDKILEELDIYLKKYYKPVPSAGSNVSNFSINCLNHEWGNGILGRELVHSTIQKHETIDELNEYIKKNKTTEDFPKLLEKMREEKKIKTSALYKKAGVDKSTYSRMNTTFGYHPTKNTVIKYGLALNATRDEMDELLQCAGYSLTLYEVEDVIIKFCLEKGYYDRDTIDKLFYKRLKKYFFSINEE
jgi:hypothetical protein